MPFLDTVQRIGVHFRHDQRHVAVHAPSAGIVDHDRALRRDLGRPDLGNCAAGAHEHDVGALEIVIARVPSLSKCGRRTTLRCRPSASRGERHDFAVRKGAFGQDAEHLAPNIAGRADHRHFILTCAEFPVAHEMRAGAHIRQTAGGEKRSTRFSFSRMPPPSIWPFRTVAFDGAFSRRKRNNSALPSATPNLVAIRSAMGRSTRTGSGCRVAQGRSIG